MHAPFEEGCHYRIVGRGGVSQGRTWHRAPPASHGSPPLPSGLRQTVHQGTARTQHF